MQQRRWRRKKNLYEEDLYWDRAGEKGRCQRLSLQCTLNPIYKDKKIWPWRWNLQSGLRRLYSLSITGFDCPNLWNDWNETQRSITRKTILEMKAAEPEGWKEERGLCYLHLNKMCQVETLFPFYV
ncbi:hypothetical protein GDO81_002785 [Engystomops pustulosus]|uniref:Uncharacterized protein n=1 Tax=Engystomops pustulosus TaxID=76066 RepID=A0AAV7DPF2_ENGPU|nr:hypothetical protein GDO81_002785 [Engystomops pustulosus]